MDFNAKRLALLAGVGNSEDRHDIVREYAQQLNESAEARQLNEAEEAVRKAVRRTIQKMISEGNLDFANTGITGGSVHVMEEEELSEDSIDDELEHLRKNVEDDKEHIDNLKRDIKADREEEDRARKAKEKEDRKDEGAEEDLNEDEDGVARNLKAKGEWQKDMLKKTSDDGYHDIELDDPDLDDHGLAEASVSVAINENDATLRRLQALAGLQILAEGRDEDVDEGSCQKHEDEDHMEEGELEEDVMETQGFDRAELKNSAPTGRGPAPRSMAYEGEDHDEAKLYELEDGRMYMEMHGKKFMMQEVEEDPLDEMLDEVEIDKFIDKDGNTWSKQ